MDFINATGRAELAAATPRACMCSSGFTSTRTTSDACWKCGCGCGDDGAYKTGNRVNAATTWRKS